MLDLCVLLSCLTCILHDAGHSDEEIDRDMALAYMGLKPMSGSGKLADSADPTWLDRESPPTVPIVSSDHDSAAKSNVSCFSTPVVPHVSEESIAAGSAFEPSCHTHYLSHDIRPCGQTSIARSDISSLE